MYPDDFAQVAAVEGYEIPSGPRRGSAGNGYACRAGITKRISPHSLRHNLITAGLDAGVPLRDVQDAASHADPRTTMRYDRARQSLDRHATYIVAALCHRRRPLTHEPAMPGDIEHRYRPVAPVMRRAHCGMRRAISSACL